MFECSEAIIEKKKKVKLENNERIAEQINRKFDEKFKTQASRFEEKFTIQDQN